MDYDYEQSDLLVTAIAFDALSYSCIVVNSDRAWTW